MDFITSVMIGAGIGLILGLILLLRSELKRQAIQAQEKADKDREDYENFLIALEAKKNFEKLKEVSGGEDGNI